MLFQTLHHKLWAKTNTKNSFITRKPVRQINFSGKDNITLLHFIKAQLPHLSFFLKIQWTSPQKLWLDQHQKCKTIDIKPKHNLASFHQNSKEIVDPYKTEPKHKRACGFGKECQQFCIYSSMKIKCWNTTTMLLVNFATVIFFCVLFIYFYKVEADNFKYLL